MNSLKTLEVLFSIATLLALFNQSFHALRSLHISYAKQNYSFHRSYFISKIFFLVTNLIRLLISDKDDCSLLKKEDVCTNQTKFNFSIGLLWSFWDFYFTLIIFSCCQRIQRGEFEQTTVLASRAELQKLKTGIILETIGKKPDEFKIKCQEISISIDIAKKEKPKYFKVFFFSLKFLNFLKIFPLPLVKKQNNLILSKKKQAIVDFTL